MRLLGPVNKQSRCLVVGATLLILLSLLTSSVGVAPAEAEHEDPAIGVGLTFESRSKATGSSIQIPLTLSGAQELIGNMDITVSYNTSVLQATEGVKGSLTGNSLFDHNIQGGTTRISLAHSQGFSGEGSVAYVRFNVIGAEGSTSPLDIVGAEAN